MTVNNDDCFASRCMALDIAYDFCTKIAIKSQHNIDPHIVVEFLQKSGIEDTDIKAVSQGILEIMMAFAILSQDWLNFYDKHYINQHHQWHENDEHNKDRFMLHSHYSQPEYDTGRGTDGQCNGLHRQTYRIIALSELNKPERHQKRRRYH